MNKTLLRLEEIRNHGYPLEFGTAIDQTLQNYKKIFLICGLIFLVFIIIFYAALAAGMGAFFAFGGFTEGMSGFDPYSLTVTQHMIGLLGKVFGAILVAPLIAGVINMAHLAETGRPFSFSTPFEMYQSPFVKDILISTLLISFVTQGLNTLMDMLDATEGGLAINFVAIGGYIVSLLIALFTILTTPLIIFGELKAIDAIKASFLVVSKKFWIILFLIIVTVIGATLVGLLALCIGILFTFPIFYSLLYIIYRTAMPINDENELDEIGRSDEWL